MTQPPVLAGRACVVRYQPYSDPDGRREAEALAHAGMDVTLLCVRKDGEKRSERIEGITVRRLRTPKQRGGIAAHLVDYMIWFVAGFTWITINHLRRPFALIQVSSLPDFQVFTTLIPRMGGAKTVLFLKEPAAELVESTGGPSSLANTMRRVTRKAIRWSDLTFTVTDQHRALYEELGADRDRLVTIENTPPPEYLGIQRADRRSSEDFFVLCHGTIEERYGHKTIVEAADILRSRGAPVRIVITGSGTWAGDLEQLITDLEIGDLVDFRGFVDAHELGELLLTASAGVVAQLESPYSSVVHTQKMYEFFSLGIPVIASRLRATATYFPDAIEFFTPGDATSLAESIARLADDPARRAGLVANADSAYEALSWPRLEQRYLEAIADVF